MSHSITPHEAHTFSDIVDGGLGIACFDYTRHEGCKDQPAGLEIMPDEMLVQDVISILGEAKRRGLNIGAAVVEVLGTQEN